MKRFLVLAALIMTLLACYGTDAVNPPTGPGSEYPCGVWGVVCSETATSAVCCPQGDVCGSAGAFSTCAAGFCCDDGVPDITDPPPMARIADAGPVPVHAPRRQRTQYK